MFDRGRKIIFMALTAMVATTEALATDPSRLLFRSLPEARADPRTGTIGAAGYS